MRIFELLDCRRYCTELDTTQNQRIVKDYEIDFHVAGNITMVLDGCPLYVKAGDIVFRKPGQVLSSKGIYDCWGVTLNLSDEEISRTNYTRKRPGNCQKKDYESYLNILPSAMRARHFDECIAVIKKMMTASNKNLQPLLGELCSLLLADAFSNSIDLSQNEQRLKKATIYIQENFSQKITIAQLAELVNYTPTHFINLFTKVFGMSPGKYLINTRLENAEFLLVLTDFTIAEIAEKCGYNNPSFFVKHFKKKYGLTPSQYRYMQTKN